MIALEDWFNGIPQSAWVVIPLAVLAVVVLSRIFMLFLHPVLLSIAARTSTTFDNDVIDRILRPLELIAAISFITIAMPYLPLDEDVRSFLYQVEKTLYILAFLWLIFRIIDVVSERKVRQLSEGGKSSAASVLPLLRRTVKVVLFAIILLFFMQNFGIDIGALLAGLGIGGLVIALAGQKTIENLFGGVVLVLDQPIQVGDYCRVGTDLVGTVEDIGLRSTRIRTLDRTVITMPNADFSQMKIENYGKRDRIRLYTTIGVRYETTPDQMRYLLVELRKMLHAHPKLDREPLRVRFSEFAAYSLNIEIMAYALTQHWAEYVAVREDIYLRILEIVNNSGTGFAFPSQTLYMERGSGVSAEKTKRAEEKVEGWRNEGQLFMPDIPEDEIGRLDDTLDYPPKGGILNDSNKK
ncbi:mechanosensitive ion channel family protein [Emcibacter sp.]|uniref:mechanosensitive ion channel family protein n=1 Tax=Emcibacter sp. TaxID=1979954 RepID=UPI003A926748